MPDVTKDKFITINYMEKEVKAYKTGDIAKINKHLEIEFIRKN